MQYSAKRVKALGSTVVYLRISYVCDIHLSMEKIKGPGIFLAQFLRDSEPYNNIESISSWVASLGFKGIQLPTWDRRVIDLDRAASSKDYCDDYKGRRRSAGLEVIELAAYLQGQVMAIHPAYELLFQSFYPRGYNDQERLEWARGELKKTVTASVNFGTTNIWF